jgi:hypothetical protein
VDQPAWTNRPAIGQELALRVVEDDDAVAQQAPLLPGEKGDGAGRVTGQDGQLTEMELDLDTLCVSGVAGAQLAAALTGRSDPDSALISAEMAEWRRILFR